MQVLVIPLKNRPPRYSMILFQDMTQLRRLETVRRDFISNVSHELRTPMASLKAWPCPCRKAPWKTHRLPWRFIIRMETEIDKLTQLVYELLELSRIDPEGAPLVPPDHPAT